MAKIDTMILFPDLDPVQIEIAIVMVKVSLALFVPAGRNDMNNSGSGNDNGGATVLNKIPSCSRESGRGRVLSLIPRLSSASEPFYSRNC